MTRFPSTLFSPQSFQAPAAIMSELAQRSLDAARALGELNAHVAQELLADSAEATRQIVSCTNPLQAVAVALTAGQRALEHLSTYQGRLLSLVTLFPSADRRSTPHLQSAAPARSRVSGGDVMTNTAHADDAARAAGYSRLH